MLTVTNTKNDSNTSPILQPFPLWAAGGATTLDQMSSFTSASVDFGGGMLIDSCGYAESFNIHTYLYKDVYIIYMFDTIILLYLYINTSVDPPQDCGRV